VRIVRWVFVCCAVLLSSGCAIWESETTNRGGYLDHLLDEHWIKADSQRMRALRAFALQVSLARIASVSSKNDSDRQLLAIRIGATTKRALPVLACALDRNPLGGRNPCFYYDSAMVDYSTALFDLAMVALPIEDAKKLITAATQGDVYVSQLLSALCVPASEFETLKKSQQVGPVTQAQIAIYRKTNNLSAPDSAKLNRAEATAVRQLGPCGTGLGKNPFEKKTYVQVTPGQAEAAMAELIGFLKKISPTAQLDPKTTKLDNVRTLITEARRHPRIAPKLKNLPPAFNDQITPDLYEALFDL
jgi:hypothetical protein